VKQALDTETDVIVAHVLKLRESEGWLSGYIPAPTTYLNQRRWDNQTTVLPVRVGK
jgi:hypothetical protein